MDRELLCRDKESVFLFCLSTAKGGTCSVYVAAETTAVSEFDTTEGTLKVVLSGVVVLLRCTFQSPDARALGRTYHA